MIKFIAKIKFIIFNVILLIIMIALLIVLLWAKNNSDLAEAWTRSFGANYAVALSKVTSWIPFSFTEISIIALVAFIIIFIIKIIKSLLKLDVVGAISKVTVIINSIMAVFLIYNATCELAYNRKPVDLPFYETKVENSEFKDIFNYFAEDLNYCVSQLDFKDNGDLNNSLSIKDISLLVEDSYKIITSDYYNKSTAHAKPMISSFIYRELQLTGVTFAPYAEANVNYLATNLEKPFVVAHELAHTKGVMREDDANQVAFYVCLNSDNEYLRFSAYGLYFYQLRSFANSSYISEEEVEQLISVDEKYYKAIKYASDYWKEHDLLGKIGDAINNAYITSSGVQEGTTSYSGGTEISFDPVTLELNPSLYQKLFFEKYYRNK